MVLVLCLLRPAQAGSLSTVGAAVMIFSVLLAGFALLAFWHGQRPRELAWDGMQWRLHEAGREGDAGLHVTVRLDLQRAMLLRCQGFMRGSGSACWLWVEARGGDERWHLLRCALYFSGAEADILSGPANPA